MLDDSAPTELIKIYEAAFKMKQEGYADSFVQIVFEVAKEYPGVRDLLNLWNEEEDIAEKLQIISDLEDLICDIAPDT